MAAQHKEISPKFQEFITKQKVFFVGTAAREGRVNISPKGLDSLRIIGPNRVVWLNLTGSGNETAAHLLDTNRMTIMFCSFEEKPLILRLYGSAKVYHERDEEFHEFINLFPEKKSARQIYDLDIAMVQTSCGYAVPFMDFKEERTTLDLWAKNRDREQIRDYWKQKNTKSIDDFPTGIFE